MKILTLFSIGLICTGAVAQDYRTFTSSDGTFSIRAALVDLETDNDNQTIAVLKRRDTGKTIRVNLARLADADRAYVGSAESIMSVPPVMRGRLTPGARKGLREKYGSDLKCEAAVDAGLRWLSQKQNADGSWGIAHQAGMTGFALMALCGQGHGPLSRQYGDAVKRGTAWLVGTGKKNREAFAGIFSTKPAVISSTYEHAVATQALAEVYALSRRGKDALLPGEVVRQAGMIIIKKQTGRGSWGYKDGIGYDPHDGNDLSVSGWQIHALRACRDAGMKIDGMDTAFTKAGKYLQSKQTADGGFGNPDVNQHYNQWNLSGAALSALQSIGSKPTGPLDNDLV